MRKLRHRETKSVCSATPHIADQGLSLGSLDTRLTMEIAEDENTLNILT